MDVTVEGIRALQGLPITTLNLNRVDHVNGYWAEGLLALQLKALQGLPIKTLSLYESDGFSDENLKTLHGLSITSLGLNFGSFSHYHLIRLHGLPITTLRHDEENETDEDEENRSPWLRNRGLVTDGTIKSLQGMPITALTLENLYDITDQGIKSLQGMPITTLTIRSRVSDTAVKALHGLPITTLALRGSAIEPNAIKALD